VLGNRSLSPAINCGGVARGTDAARGADERVRLVRRALATRHPRHSLLQPCSSLSTLCNRCSSLYRHPPPPAVTPLPARRLAQRSSNRHEHSFTCKCCPFSGQGLASRGSGACVLRVVSRKHQSHSLDSHASDHRKRAKFTGSTSQGPVFEARARQGQDLDAWGADARFSSPIASLLKGQGATG